MNMYCQDTHELGLATAGVNGGEAATGDGLVREDRGAGGGGGDAGGASEHGCDCCCRCRVECK